MRIQSVRKVTPLLVILFGAASTGTILASDSCGISLVQRMTDATRKAREHVGPAHKHTQETLAKWEIWGNEYLAKHGHAYQPPKRRVARNQPPDQENRVFEFLCDLPPVPELAVWSDGLLDPILAPAIEPELTQVAENGIPPTVIPAPPVDTTYYGTPVLLVPIGGVPVAFIPPVTTPNAPTTPATPVGGGTTPIATTPEPGPVLLLATGVAAVLELRRRRRAAMTSGSDA